MADFNDDECIWFPELEQCNPQNNNGNGNGNNSGGGGTDFPFPNAALAFIPPIVVIEDPWIMPLMGNIAFLTIATFWTIIPMIRQFKWRLPSSSFYQVWDDANLGSNLWQVSYQLLDYGRMLIFLTALVTQSLAMAGLYPNLNQLVWNWGVSIGGLGLDVLFQLFLWAALERARRKSINTDETAAMRQASGIATFYISHEWITFYAGNALTLVVMGLGYESWMAAHYKLTGQDKIELNLGFGV